MAKQTTLYMSDGSTFEEVLVATDYSLVKNKPSNFPPTAHNHDASNITSGTLGVARIPGLDTGKITSGEFNPERIRIITSKDTRSTDPTPGEHTKGVQFDFRGNTTNGLSDGGTYHGLMSFRPYGNSSIDFSGGPAHQLGFTQNRGLFHRKSIDKDTWGAWIKILNDDDVPSWAKAPTKPTYTQDQVGDGSTYKRVTQSEKNTWDAKEPAISKTEDGLLRIAEGIVITDSQNYLTSVPTASASVLGGIKVGNRLSISSGVLSADSQTDNNFTTTLKNKLDGIATGATNVVEATVSGWGFTKNTGTVTGSGTSGRLAFWTGTNSIDALGPGTYPSLTELSYVKGVTSAIQTQLNGKLSTSGTAYNSTRFGGKQLRVGSYTSGASGYITLGY